MPKLLLAGWGAPRSGTIPIQIRASLLLQVPPRTGLVLQGERGISGFWLGGGGLRPSLGLVLGACVQGEPRALCPACRPAPQPGACVSSFGAGSIGAQGCSTSWKRCSPRPGAAAGLLLGCFGFGGWRGNGE